jgi:hypothetical protein
MVGSISAIRATKVRNLGEMAQCISAESNSKFDLTVVAAKKQAPLVLTLHKDNLLEQ